MGSVPARHLGRKVGVLPGSIAVTLMVAWHLCTWLLHAIQAILIAAGACMKPARMHCREEELAEAKTGTEGRSQGRHERAVWMAHAETAVASPVRSALWSDSQFHILEMQTGTPHRSPATRFCSSCLCVTITLHEQHAQDAGQHHSLRKQTRASFVFPGSCASQL